MSTTTKNNTENLTKVAENQAIARRFETRDNWAVVFNHAVSLVLTLSKGEALPEKARDGFSFGKTAEQPHIKDYAKSLLIGFTTGKAGKILKDFEGIRNQEDRVKIVITILKETKLSKGNTDEEIFKNAAKVGAKQAKTFAETILQGLSN